MKLALTKTSIFTKIEKKKQIIILCICFLFASYCAIKIGSSWDEKFHFLQGKTILEFLFSFGKIDKDIIYRQNYSASYWSLLYLLTSFFPINFQLEASHLINLFFSISVIYALSNICKIFFNKTVARISFLILFFYPIFFGHMAFNNKDTIIALSHLWITYLVFRYLKYQDISYKRNKYVLSIAILAAVATGIQLVFIGSLIPLFLVLIFEIFFNKKIINQNFEVKKFYIDIIKSFIIFYCFLLFFWIDAYPNIFVLPFKFLFSTLSDNFWTGWAYNLVNGKYFLSNETPKNYLILNLIYKSPEYFIFLYVFFIIALFFYFPFLKKNFKNFKYNFSIIILFIFFPHFTLFLIPYPIYDGLRLFIWVLPYFCIIPALALYVILKNVKKIKIKFCFVLFLLMLFYYIFDFVRLTPYQYIYLNVFTGKKENRYNKFENDYWGGSIRELIENFNLDKKSKILISACGININSAKTHFKKMGFKNLEFVKTNESNYIIMTNRAIFNQKKITNCFEEYKGEEISQVRRNKQTLSVIRKIN